MWFLIEVTWCGRRAAGCWNCAFSSWRRQVKWVRPCRLWRQRWRHRRTRTTAAAARRWWSAASTRRRWPCAISDARGAELRAERPRPGWTAAIGTNERCPEWGSPGPGRLRADPAADRRWNWCAIEEPGDSIWRLLRGVIRRHCRNPAAHPAIPRNNRWLSTWLGSPKGCRMRRPRRRWDSFFSLFWSGSPARWTSVVEASRAGNRRAVIPSLPNWWKRLTAMAARSRSQSVPSSLEWNRNVITL